ncbi:2'-5' RNA ligase [Kribbella amoyensis]|uniref:2'-5' RNA ligase n=1 Tax=Kribbella amoyensis TaxID=996641 RepID=A0A561BLS6_9ACTN|nr:2'-5' RNA ligase family protein [Kribbella amoyensis]TWD79850.1 2'-5' RNA ligase [Kribbella amoyensis]
MGGQQLDPGRASAHRPDTGSTQRTWTERAGLTALLIAVPELARYTDRWRTGSYSSVRPDLPLSALIPPHVTVLVPWVADPRPEHVQRLTDALADVPPFQLGFDGVGRFPNGTVYLRPEPFDEVLDVIQRVLKAFPECPPYGGEHPDPYPHLTIASSGQGTDELVAEAETALELAAPPTVLLDDLTIWREGGDQIWRLVGSVPLGTG